MAATATVTLQYKVPAAVHRAAKTAAASKGMTLKEFLEAALSEKAERSGVVVEHNGDSTPRKRSKST